MRRLLTWLAVILCLCITTGAAAEISLVPQMAQWDASLPMEITLRADVKTHMPFDDDRCAQLNALLKHISLRLNTSQEAGVSLGRVSVRVDDQEALWLAQRQEGESTHLRLSWKPETYIASGDAISGLTGESVTDLSLYGLTGDEQQWLDDGAEMMKSIGDALQKYKKQSSIKTSIKNMGTARTKIVYTVPKGDAEVFAQAVADHCPEGELRSFLTGLTYSGQQKLLLWLDADGNVLRAEYAGKCGAGEDELRNVSLVWRMKRAEDDIRDDVTLKTPAVKGSDYNNLTCARENTADEAGVVALHGKFSYTVRTGNEKSTLSGEVKLTGSPEGDNQRLSGSAMVKQKLPGDDYAAGTVLMPDVLIGSEGATPVVSGTVEVQELQGDQVIEDAVIHLEVSAGDDINWPAGCLVVNTSAMTPDQSAAMLEGMSAALIPRLVLLPAEDTLYLSADLSEDVWQGIVEAARSVLPEEETP